ncbi:MAG: hypothetical protein A2046_10005 [Bacteroidetes bacterium GWA2_30_7]|nr:MAG: hypothetical protein A2046_10005 [Bacteroidetes bacterium GWA2_30_7]
MRKSSSANNELSFEKVWKLFQDTDKKFQETREQMKDTDKKIKELSSLFTSQWGKLIEALVEPSCLRLFQERGINISQSSTRMKANKKGKEMEVDIVLMNGTEMVVIEVKTTMKVEYINEFIEKLNKFKLFFPHFKNLTLYGAVAALRYDEESDKFAYRNGMYVLKSVGESLMKIANNKKFKATKF